MSNRPRWLVPVAIALAVLLLVVFPLVGAYNNLVSRRAAVDQSFADLDAQLQRRNDLIPNLVNTVRGILKQEQAVFGEIARARQNYAGARSLPDKAAASQTIDSALARLLVIVENYPQLKSSQNVQDLMTSLEGTENRITQGRRDYNGIATSYNVNIKQFPRNIIAGVFGFHAKQLFQANVESRQAPNVNLDVSTSPSPP